MNIPGFEDLMKQAQAFNQQLAKLREELARETVEGTAGGGMVQVVANGQGRLMDVKIEPQVIDPDEAEMLQDLVVAAVNQALAKAKELAAGKTRGLTGGLAIPGLENLLG